MGTVTANGDGAPTVPEQQAEIARVTYRYLRWLMVFLPLVLLFVTMANAIAQRELESSISAYYGTPVRDVFVGVMIATAACMVAYQGSSLLEDYTLNGAGFYAVFVALVPTNLDEILQELRQNPPGDGVTVMEYISSLRIAIFTVLVLCGALVVIELKESERLARLWKRGPQSKGFIALTGAVLAAFLVLVVVKLYLHPADEVTMDGFTLGPVDVRVHDLAAILLIAALAVAVASHAWPQAVANREGAGLVPASDLEVRNRYQLIFWLMVAGPFVAWGFSKLAPDHWIIFLECGRSCSSACSG